MPKTCFVPNIFSQRTLKSKSATKSKDGLYILETSSLDDLNEKRFRLKTEREAVNFTLEFLVYLFYMGKFFELATAAYGVLTEAGYIMAVILRFLF